MKMIYLKGDEEIEYSLATDPEEAATWTTYKLKKNDIRLAKSYGRTETADIKQEILDDIAKTEGGNPPRRNAVQKECETADSEHAQVGKKQQKTRRRSNQRRVERVPAIQPNARRTRNVSR